MRKARVVAHSRPSIGAAERSAVLAVLKSGMLAQDGQVRLLEVRAAEMAGVRHGAAVSSGTAALFLALKALGAGPGKEVVIPSYVCSALWHAVKFCGAEPVLADCDPRTFNISADTVKNRLGRRTAAIVAPHMFGLPADIAGLKRFGVPVVEDCAQALGARLGARKAGSVGEAGVLSFYATKLAAAGEGGMVVSDSRVVARCVKNLRAYDEKPPDEPRLNFKLTDLQAALARVQLGRLREFLAKRAALAAVYDRLLPGSLVLPQFEKGRVYHRYVVLLPKGRPAAAVARDMERRGVSARKPVFRPLHLDVSCAGNFPGAQEAWERALSLPLHTDMRTADCVYCVRALEKSLVR